jgi:hypothetical protein
MSERLATLAFGGAAARCASRAGMAALLTSAALLAPLPAAGQDWHTSSFARQASGERELQVNVEYGGGQLKIAPAASGTLYRARVRYDADAFEPKVSYANGRLRFSMDGGGNVRGHNLKEGLLDLSFAPNVPLHLNLAFGAADATIELGGLRVNAAEIHTGASRTMLRVSEPNRVECRSLEVEVGAARFEAVGLGNLNARSFTLKGGVGEMVLDFTGSWQRDMTARIEMGLGSLTLRVPTGLGVRVEKGGMLATFDSQGLTRRGSVYYSENWERAQHKLSIDLDAALGSIRVEWVDS